MKTIRFFGGKARWLLPLLALLLIVFAAAPARASGQEHPAPSVIHDYKVVVQPNAADVTMRLMVSPQLVPQFYRVVDTNFDAVTSDAEQQVWLDKYVANMAFTVDGTQRPFTVTGSSKVTREALLLSMSKGITLTLHLDYPTAAASSVATAVEHRFILSDNSNWIGYDEYYVAFNDGAGVTVTTHDLTNTSDPAVFEAIFEVDPGATPAQPSTASPAEAPPQEPAGGELLARLDDFLTQPGGDMTLALFIFVLAVGVGALHALTPGHGKAVVAAYLVGSRGRVKDAILLGFVVTLTHTSSVVLLGLVLLLVNNFAMPRYLQPLLELISGLLIVGMGLWLLAQRWRAARQATAVVVAAPQPALAYAGANEAHFHAEHDHTHPHDHDHGHTHSHEDHTHSHGPGEHSHSHAIPAGASLRDLIALGISGGLVPCPDALAIMLLAAGFSQVGLGLALVTSFSIGLAATLIGIGILMVKAKSVLERLLPGDANHNPTWVSWLPVASAVAVVVLGVAVVVGAAIGQKWV